MPNWETFLLLQNVISNSSATIWTTSSRRAKSTSLSVGDERLRLSVLRACAIEAAFIVFLTVFLFQHADPRGGGMEMVGIGFAFMLIFLPLTLPAFIFARHGRWLLLSAGLAALAAVAYFAFWLETVSELGLPKSWASRVPAPKGETDTADLESIHAE
jgi:hypothetical protein